MGFLAKILLGLCRSHCECPYKVLSRDGRNSKPKICCTKLKCTCAYVVSYLLVLDTMILLVL